MKFVIFLLVHFLSTSIWAETFTQHISSKSTSTTEQVQFATGYTAYVDRSTTPKLVVSHTGGKSIQLPISDDFLEVVGAYPNGTAAQVMLVASRCGGNTCGETNLFVVYAYKGTLVSHVVVTQDSADVEVQTNQISAPQVLVSNLQTREKNAYGDPIKSAQLLHPGKGFVDTRASPDFVKVIEERPEVLFASPLRISLIKALGVDRFRELRETMSVGSSSIVDGRYLVLRGCCRKGSKGNNGAAVIDVVSNNAWAAWHSEDGAEKVGATRPWTQEIAHMISNAGVSVLYKGNALTFQTNSKPKITQIAAPATTKGGNIAKETPNFLADFQQKLSSPFAAMSDEHLIAALKVSLTRALRDPDSVKFRDIKLNSKRTALCGEYNSKNGFGAYVGFRGFISSPSKLVQQNDNPSDFAAGISSFEYGLAKMEKVCE